MPINVVCSECKSLLLIQDAQVVPCEKCILEAFDKGQAKGFDEGVASVSVIDEVDAVDNTPWGG